MQDLWPRPSYSVQPLEGDLPVLDCLTRIGACVEKKWQAFRRHAQPPRLPTDQPLKQLAEQQLHYSHPFIPFQMWNTLLAKMAHPCYRRRGSAPCPASHQDQWKCIRTPPAPWLVFVIMERLVRSMSMLFMPSILSIYDYVSVYTFVAVFFSILQLFSPIPCFTKAIPPQPCIIQLPPL